MLCKGPFLPIIVESLKPFRRDRKKEAICCNFDRNFRSFCTQDWANQLKDMPTAQHKVRSHLFSEIKEYWFLARYLTPQPQQIQR